MRCDDVLTAIFLGAPLDPAAHAHLEGCASCRAEAAASRTLACALAAASAPTPPPELGERVRTAAAPLLAQNARRATWTALARAVGAALVPLPLVVLADLLALRLLYNVLAGILPAALSAYLIVNSAAAAALLLALTYGSIAVLAERQARLRGEVAHG